MAPPVQHRGFLQHHFDLIASSLSSSTAPSPSSSQRSSYRQFAGVEQLAVEQHLEVAAEQSLDLAVRCIFWSLLLRGSVAFVLERNVVGNLDVPAMADEDLRLVMRIASLEGAPENASTTRSRSLMISDPPRAMPVVICNSSACAKGRSRTSGVTACDL